MMFSLKEAGLQVGMHALRRHPRGEWLGTNPFRPGMFKKDGNPVEPNPDWNEDVNGNE
jgi:hypothetical protein